MIACFGPLLDNVVDKLFALSALLCSTGDIGTKTTTLAYGHNLPYTPIFRAHEDGLSSDEPDLSEVDVVSGYVRVAPDLSEVSSQDHFTDWMLGYLTVSVMIGDTRPLNLV